MADDLRSILRVAQGHGGQPRAVIFDGRTLQSSCESGPRAGYDGYKRKKGSKAHMAADTLGYLLAVKVRPANEQERARTRCWPRWSRTKGNEYLLIDSTIVRAYQQAVTGKGGSKIRLWGVAWEV